MKVYLDTNILISAVDEKDSLHEEALQLIDEYRDMERITSELTLIELASVYSRAGFNEPHVYALATIKTMKTKIIKIDFNKVLTNAFKYSGIVKLRTLDLLHVMAAIMMGANYFMTFDKDIINRKEIVKRLG